MSSHAVSPGDILHLYIGVIGKPKFCVVGCLDPKVRLLLINSEPAQFIQQNPEMMGCQVRIDQRSHGFLDYDSWIDCTDPMGCDIDKIHNEIAADPSIKKGRMSDPVRDRVRKAVTASPTIPPRQIDWILTGLS